MKRRLFTGIEPSSGFIDAVTSLHAGLPGANWETQPHITLSHFGDLEADQVDELLAALSMVSFDPFELHPDQFGIFGEADAPSVVWLGFDPSTELDSLYAQLSTVRSQFASRPERHGFNPHLTIARTEQCDGNAVREYLDDGLGDASLRNLGVTGFELFESVNFEYASLARYEA